MQLLDDAVSTSLLLIGQLDLSCTDLLEDPLLRLESDDRRVLVLDLEQLEFMDCSGLNVCIAAKERTGAAGKSVELVNAGGQVGRLFKITRQNHLLTT